MTDIELLESNDVNMVFQYAMKFASERQLRLFACACCRRVWHLLIDERSRKAVETAELYANGEVGDEVLQTVNNAANQAWIQRSQCKDDHAAAAAFYCSTLKPSLLPAAANRVQATVEDKSLEIKQQAALLREILASPSA
jgi:hypothetical protein